MLKKSILLLFIFLSIGFTFSLNANPKKQDLLSAVKHINRLKIKDNYGYNYIIDNIYNEILYFNANFTGKNRNECLVYIPCSDNEAPRMAENLNFVVLFYKNSKDKWLFSKYYLEVHSLDTLDFEKDGVVEILTEIGWTQNGETGVLNQIYSLKKDKINLLYKRESSDFDGQVMAPDDLNKEKQFLYEFKYKDINSDNKIDIIETYKVGKIVKFEGKSETPIYKYKTTIKNYLNINGKFVLDKKSKKK